MLVEKAGGTITQIFGDSSDSNISGTISDTFIDIGNGNINYSTDSQNMIVYTWPDNSSANRIVMKVDISAIPTNATILNAELLLYQYDSDGDGTDPMYDTSIHKVINHDPVIPKCTWNTYDGLNEWTGGANGGLLDMTPPVSSMALDQNAGYKSWNITGMVQELVPDPSTNFGLIIEADGSSIKNRFRSFRPSEYSNQDQRPKLVVTYSTGGDQDRPAPPTNLRVISVYP